MNFKTFFVFSKATMITLFFLNRFEKLISVGREYLFPQLGNATPPSWVIFSFPFLTTAFSTAENSNSLSIAFCTDGKNLFTERILTFQPIDFGFISLRPEASNSFWDRSFFNSYEFPFIHNLIIRDTKWNVKLSLPKKIDF